MKNNKIINILYYISLAILFGVIFFSLTNTLNDKYVSGKTFVNYFISNLFSLGGYVGFYFSPIAIITSSLSWFVNKEKTKYFIITLLINIFFIISTYILNQAVFNSINMI